MKTFLVVIVIITSLCLIAHLCFSVAPSNSSKDSSTGKTDRKWQKKHPGVWELKAPYNPEMFSFWVVKFKKEHPEENIKDHERLIRWRVDRYPTHLDFNVDVLKPEAMVITLLTEPN